MDRFAAVDADARREALDAGVARPVHVPFARRVAGFRVLADDRVHDRFARPRRRRPSGTDPEEGEDHQAQQA